jgi:xanthine dehydrogenase accessory factor
VTAGLEVRAERLRGERTPFVLATVVRTERPASARAGDRALVLPDGTLEGFVGGMCAASAVRAQALRLLESGESTLLRITPGPDEPDGPAGEGLVTVSNPCLSGGTLDLFLEAVIPPALLQVYGDGPVARALAEVGAAAGFAPRPADGPGTPVAADAAAVVVATHGRDEEPILTAALRAGVPYVGLVASRRRGAAVTAAVEGAGRVRTPAGLDIGARTAPEIALSVVAEIVALRPRRGPGEGAAHPESAHGAAHGACHGADHAAGHDRG